MGYSEYIIEKIMASANAKKKLAGDREIIKLIESATEAILESYHHAGKLLLCGNGGSAADAQHLAAELVVRFYKERQGYPAIALNANTSVLTAVANDYIYEKTFSRQIEALGNEKDVLIAISTSGNSANIVNAVNEAKRKNIFTIGLLGNTGGKCASLCDIPIIVPFEDVPRIQECHIMIGHILCELVENKMTG